MAHNRTVLQVEKNSMNEKEGASAQNKSDHNHIFAGHLGQNRPYWRDIVLGVNDGLVSTFLLVAGVSGAGFSISDTLLTGISGALAGVRVLNVLLPLSHYHGTVFLQIGLSTALLMEFSFRQLFIFIFPVFVRMCSGDKYGCRYYKDKCHN